MRPGRWAACKRIAVPDLRVRAPDLQDRLWLVGGKRELKQLLRPPLEIGDLRAPNHPPQASQDVHGKRRDALVRDRIQQEVQQRLAAVCADRKSTRLNSSH